MRLAFALGVMIFVAIAIIAVAVVIYLIIYRRRINKQLNGEAVKSRRLPSPLAFSISTVLVVAVVFAGVTAFMALTDFGAEKIPAEYRNAVYEYQAFSPSQMTGYRRFYSLYENPGYTKTVEQRGDIRFTCFASDNTFDFYHPAFIIYAEYTGDNDILYYGVQGDYFLPDERQMTGKGHAGSEFEDYICVIGTSSIQSRFELTVYLYDSGLKSSEDKGEYAVASEAISIILPTP